MTLIQGVAPRTAKRQIELNATPACAESVGGAFSFWGHFERCVCGPDAPNSEINTMFNNFHSNFLCKLLLDIFPFCDIIKKTKGGNWNDL